MTDSFKKRQVCVCLALSRSLVYNLYIDYFKYLQWTVSIKKIPKKMLLFSIIKVEKK